MRRRLLRFVAFCGCAAIVLVRSGAEPASQENRRQFDPDAVARGQQVLTTHCGFCHGSNARGAAGGPDLLRSPIVMEDENGKQLGEFLKVGRPDKGMPKVDLAPPQVSDLAEFLHERIAAAADRGSYKILNILTGDAKAGEAFFNGAGGCRACHSPTGDMKGIGGRYDPVTLQSRFIMPPRGRGGRGRGAAEEKLAPPATVTVTLPSGESFTGAIVRLTDFEVALRESSGAMRSWLRNGDTPKVVINDPLKPHFELLTRWTDTDMHNMTAYLTTLK